jgi:SAM-dependent methyltransferase
MRHIEQKVVTTALQALGASLSVVDDFLRKMWEVADSSYEILELEESLHKLVPQLIDNDLVTSGIHQRAELIARQVAPFVCGQTIADIGCGNGMVCWYLNRRESDTKLADEKNYLDPHVRPPFTLLTSPNDLSLLGTVDTSLLLTILHHAKGPLELFEAVTRLTRRRIIIIESVFGVPSESFEPFLSARSSYEDQLDYAVFVDWR